MPMSRILTPTKAHPNGRPPKSALNLTTKSVQENKSLQPASPRATGMHSQEPTIHELLNQGKPSRMLPVTPTANNRMDVDGPSVTGTVANWRKGIGFKACKRIYHTSACMIQSPCLIGEQLALKNPEVKRKADMAQLCKFALRSPSTTK